jgi:hypothetical protein
MGLSDDIVAALREKYRAGATFAELAKSSGVSLTYLRSLTVGERDPMKMSLDFFLRLFPFAQIELAPARVPDDPGPDMVPRSEYQDLRDKYQDLRDQYLDLRDQYQELRSSRLPYVRDERPEHPYRVSGPSTSSRSSK